MTYFRKEAPYTSNLNHVKDIVPPIGAPVRAYSVNSDNNPRTNERFSIAHKRTQEMREALAKK